MTNIESPWLPVVQGVWGDEAFQKYVVEVLRSGEMTPEDQRWLAECFDPNGQTRFSLGFTLRPGRHTSAKRLQQFRDNIEAFRTIRDAVWDEFRREIDRDGDEACKKADTEAVKRATVTIKVLYGGKRKHISERAAYTLLAAVKADDEAFCEANEAFVPELK